MAKFEEDGWLREWYDMTKARSFVEFKRVLSPLNMLFGNVMYADRQGNTFYLYNAAVPRRDPSFDWTKVVGQTPAEECWHVNQRSRIANNFHAGRYHECAQPQK